MKVSLIGDIKVINQGFKYQLSGSYWMRDFHIDQTIYQKYEYISGYHIGRPFKTIYWAIYLLLWTIIRTMLSTKERKNKLEQCGRRLIVRFLRRGTLQEFIFYPVKFKFLQSYSQKSVRSRFLIAHRWNLRKVQATTLQRMDYGTMRYNFFVTIKCTIPSSSNSTPKSCKLYILFKTFNLGTCLFS